MSPAVFPSWALLITAGGALFLLLILVVAIVAAFSSKSKGGTGVAIAIVALVLLAVPALGLVGGLFFYYLTPMQYQTINVPANSQVTPAPVQTRPVEVEVTPVDDAAIVKPLEEEEAAGTAGGQ